MGENKGVTSKILARPTDRQTSPAVEDPRDEFWDKLARHSEDLQGIHSAIVEKQLRRRKRDTNYRDAG